MIKQLVMYKKPADEEKFLKHYKEVHLPIVRRIPGVSKLVVNMGRDGRIPSEYFLITEMYFDDQAALELATRSPENKEAAKDIPNFAMDIISVQILEEVSL